MSPYSRLTSRCLLSSVSKWLVILTARTQGGPFPCPACCARSEGSSPFQARGPNTGLELGPPAHAHLHVLAGQHAPLPAADGPSPASGLRVGLLPFATVASLCRQQQKSPSQSSSQPATRLLLSTRCPRLPRGQCGRPDAPALSLVRPSPRAPKRSSHARAPPVSLLAAVCLRPDLDPGASALPVLCSCAPQPSTLGCRRRRWELVTLSSPGFVWFLPLCANSVQTGRHQEAPVQELLSAKGSWGSREGPRPQGRSSRFRPQRSSHRWH